MTTSRSSGKERDSETGLDFFGARYYGSNMGRWMSPDWSVAPIPVPYASLDNPQSLNLYAYVQNNPLTRFDPDGHAAIRPTFGCSPYDDLCWGNVSGYKGQGQKFVQSESKQKDRKPGRQPDGSYWAPTKPGSEIYKRLHGEMKNGLIGKGQCVEACRYFAHVPNSSLWTPGRHATDLTEDDIGTAIATFDSTGHYPSDRDPLGKNSAIFLGKGTNGSIWVVEQWPPDHGRTSAVPPFAREIRLYDPDNTQHPSRADNADAYYVIRVP